MEKFGEIVRYMMLAAGFSRRELARRADISEGTLGRVFKYSDALDCQQATKDGLARGFGLTVEAFVAAVRKRQTAAPAAAAEPVYGSLAELPKFLEWMKSLSEIDRSMAFGALRGLEAPSRKVSKAS